MAEGTNGAQSNTYNAFFDTAMNSSNQMDRIEALLKTIAASTTDDPTLAGIVGRAPRESQSNVASGSGKWTMQERHSQPKYKSTGSILGDFEKGIKDQLLDSLAGGSFKKGMQGALDTFAKEFGADIRDLPQMAGRQLAGSIAKSFSNSETGKRLKAEAGKLGSKALNAIFSDDAKGQAAKQGITKVAQSLLSGGQGGVSGAGGLTGELGSLVGTSESAGLALEGLTSAATAAGPVLLAVVVAAALLAPAFEGLADVAQAGAKAFSKSEEIRQKRAENGQKRVQETTEAMVKKPFEILEAAATQWYNTWDAQLRTVGQTQGYDKEAVYALYEGYADRLRSEGLDKVIGATDVIEKLGTVLDSGLSGEAAEEFAYIATKLNAAIPTQNFFGYVDTYASIAANSIAQGKSQSEALADANAELEQFASNLLYSSRELAGGFSTGLKNSSELFKSATQIAQTARTYNASEISGTLTSVSAIIGAVAPDLAGSLVDNVVQAAVGGNNNAQLVALRSLAGINAGNTEFLRAMAEDPQGVFTDLFTKLAQMQNMSPDNYMEVAEGLADVFGIDKAAFARVDFNYLAQAISSMNTNNSSLQENLELLASGQTTTSAEQLKAQEINSIILEEGLAYVIDSEAGRMVQQHMWDEQRDNKLMEATYAVDLQGSALSFLEGIRETITNIMNFVNPIGFIGNGVANLVAATAEMAGNQDDLAEILQLGAVGSNTRAFYNLTTTGKDLNLVTSLVEMMGGKKGNVVADALAAGAIVTNLPALYGSLASGETFNKLADAAYEGLMTGSASLSTPFGTISGDTLYGGGLLDLLGGSSNTKISRYSWGSVGKSVVQGLQSSSMNTTSLIGSVATSMVSATQNAQEASNKKFQEFLDSAEEASKTMSYDAWVDTAKSFGIADFADALYTYGRSEEEIKGYFQANQAREGALQEVARKEDEQLFRDQNREYWDYEGGSSGVFQTAMWLPFFGDGRKYDTRMDAVDAALTEVQSRIGTTERYTVISGLDEISAKIGPDTSTTVVSKLDQLHNDISTTFISTSSVFQRCLSDWIRYIDESKEYTSNVSRAQAWSDLKNAEADQRTEATLALANALGVFSAEELQKLDPQLQTNVLLGEIVTILQAIMQQNNTGGGISLMDSLSALGLGMTART